MEAIDEAPILEYGDIKARLSAALSHFLATVARVFGQVILFFDRR